MSLLTKNKEVFYTTKKTKTDDGMGGYTLALQEDTQFNAAVVLDMDNTERAADAERPDPRFLIYTTKDVFLEFHSIIKQETPERFFRIISTDEKRTPAGAGLNMVVYSAVPYEKEKEGEREDG